MLQYENEKIAVTILQSLPLKRFEVTVRLGDLQFKERYYGLAGYDGLLYVPFYPDTVEVYDKGDYKQIVE